MKRLMEEVQKFWCMNMHAKVMWPMRGKYQCATCFREFSVCYEGVEGHPAERHSDGFAGVVAIPRA